jgi:hypothetical protein
MRFKFGAAVFVLAMIFAGGCAPQVEDDGRGTLDRASVIGSCAVDDCGGQASDGNCWCDELCDFYSDCCGDKEEVCDAPQPEQCGGFANLQCSDSTMVCVDDPSDSCDPDNGGADCSGICVEPEPEPEPEFCGGFAGIQCSEGLECVDVPDDGCDPQNGGADCAGQCVEPPLCGGFGNFPCPAGLWCIDAPDSCDPNNGGADCPGICVSDPPCPTDEVVCELVCDGHTPTLPPNCGMPECECGPAADSCQDSCDGQSQTGDCWCDSWCSYWGDCCGDIADFCE